MQPIEPLWKSTQKGRVVYERKKHQFTSADVLRIVEKTKDYWITEKNMNFVVDRIRVASDIMKIWLWDNFNIGVAELNIKETAAQKIAQHIANVGREIGTAILSEVLDMLDILDILPETLLVDGADLLYDELYKAVDKLLKPLIRGEKNASNKKRNR